jgi:hypothetical protein
MIETTCSECGKSFQTWPRTLKRVKNPTCSRQCNGAARGREWAKHGAAAQKKRGPYVARFGAENPAWKGGVTLKRPKGNYKGAKYVRCPPEWISMAMQNGYIAEHRLVMAQWVGRPLTRQETVNHIDRDPWNNERSNLELYPTNADHKRGECGRFVSGVQNRWFPKD